MKSPVAVVGAAGQTGLAAICALSARAAEVRALIHRTDQADVVRAAGARHAVEIELDDPDTLRSALEGAGAVLHIPPVFDAREPTRVQAVVDAAGHAGIERFVLHSVMHPATPGLRHHERKAASEAIVRRSPLRWTILQPAMYSETIMVYWERSPTDSVIVPYSLDTPFTPVALRDVAEATAIVLSEDGHEFATYELGGPELLTGREMLVSVSRVLAQQRVVRRGRLSEIALPTAWSDSARADMAAMCEHYDTVGLTGGNRVLEMLLRRPPTRFQKAIVPVG